jgi:amidase
MTTHRKSRRDFLKTTSAALGSAPFINKLPRATAEASKFDPNFGTAAQAMEALQRGVISSRELTAHVFGRIKKHNPKINAFVTLLEEQAMAQANQADEVRAKKKTVGPLQGLPLVIKDVFATEGVRTTSGSKIFEKYVPKEDAVVVARLKSAGAIILGKTNVPEFASDWQSFNQVAGTSNNPWDVKRTPGGSTGGGAAALAAGFGFLEIGSDIGGSIRIPSHFCGVYGHKPTFDVVPLLGHIPPPPGMRAPEELPVAGPLARSAEDLKLQLEIVAGPAPDEAIAYRWNLPPPRRKKLTEYRFGYVIDDPLCPVDSTVKDVLASAVESLRKKGAQLTEGWPPGIDPKKQYENYYWLLAAFFSVAFPEEAFKGMQKAVSSGTDDPWLKGTTSLHRDWLAQSGQRLKAGETWREYFKGHDAFLMPVSFVPAFPHDQKGNLQDGAMVQRRLMTTEGERPYLDMSKWISFATLTGCPATVAPVGRTKSGLPVGIQIMGPFLEDATPIDIAAKMVDVTGGFVAPPEFAS